MTRQYEEEKEAVDRLESEIREKKARAMEIGKFIDALQKTSAPVKEFDEGLWTSLVDFITVYSEKDIRFTLKDGREIKA